MAMTPLAETANLFTAESVRIVVNAERIFLNSHTLTVLSSEPDTTLSSLVKTVDVTLLNGKGKHLLVLVCLCLEHEASECNCFFFFRPTAKISYVSTFFRPQKNLLIE